MHRHRLRRTGESFVVVGHKLGSNCDIKTHNAKKIIRHWIKVIWMAIPRVVTSGLAWPLNCVIGGNYPTAQPLSLWTTWVWVSAAAQLSSALKMTQLIDTARLLVVPQKSRLVVWSTFHLPTLINWFQLDLRHTIFQNVKQDEFISCSDYICIVLTASFQWAAPSDTSGG